MARERITVIVPVLNEAANVEGLIERLTPVLDRVGVRWQVLFIDDGSTDETLAILKVLNARDRRITAISLSRNFGKEIAIAAGLKYARGEAAILMDADLQHPPEALAAFIERWREGYQIVYGQRLDRGADGPLRRFLARIYYRMFNALARTDIPEGAGDFRLLDRCAIDAMNRIGEVSRFNKGLFSWIGFRSIGVPYSTAARTSGTSKWSFRRLARFAIDGLTSFSTLPLRVWSLLGLAISLTAFAYALIVLVQTLVLGVDVPGYPSLIISVMFFAGVQLISLGVIGEYLGRVYEEVKARPLFIVAEEIGLSEESSAPALRAVPGETGSQQRR
ncbi:MAG TPA: glycosyltransferase family 2 protein [Hyphomicrobiaceae bacterium]|nr:glycosyltransferase family 2 protein [Hyphomicrobiaceae bacterium]